VPIIELLSTINNIDGFGEQILSFGLSMAGGALKHPTIKISIFNFFKKFNF
jgi:hypothetical protein